MSKHLSSIHQWRKCLLCGATVTGLIYLTWIFAFLESTAGKGFRDTSRELDVRCGYPVDEHALGYYEKKTIRCDANDDRAVIDHVDGLRIKTDMLNGNEFCFYSEITRSLLEDKAVFSLKAPLVGAIYPKSDFTNVECTDENGTVLFSDYFAHVQPLQEVMEYNNSDTYGVAVVSVGQMSRLNFMRQMPHSYSYMRNTMDSIEMLGFTTFDNLTPHDNILAMLRGNESFILSRFIWDHFSQFGAVTLFAEDVPNMNMFRTRRLPLKRQPTHHYGNIFWDAVKDTKRANSSAENCFGKRPRHLIHLNYLLSFMRAYKNSPSFLFSLYNELTTNVANMAQVMDNDFVKLLETMVREDLLERTVLMVIGMSGQSGPRTTRRWIQEGMPLVSVIVPRSAPQQWKDALQVNRKRLTSPHDLYLTLVDILGTLTPSKLIVRLLKKMNTGTSLFREILPNRTCQDFSLVDERCLCVSRYLEM